MPVRTWLYTPSAPTIISAFTIFSFPSWKKVNCPLDTSHLNNLCSNSIFTFFIPAASVISLSFNQFLSMELLCYSQPLHTKNSYSTICIVELSDLVSLFIMQTSSAHRNGHTKHFLGKTFTNTADSEDPSIRKSEVNRLIWQRGFICGYSWIYSLARYRRVRVFENLVWVHRELQKRISWQSRELLKSPQARRRWLRRFLSRRTYWTGWLELISERNP